MAATGEASGGRSTFRSRVLRAASVAMILAAVLDVLGRDRIGEIVVSKSRRTLVVYDDGGRPVREYPIAIGGNPVGHKEREGDRRTPEGEYRICFKNPQSRYHLSLAISYPNAEDARRGRAAGAIGDEELSAIVEAERTGSIPPWKTALGGEIFIHGGLETHDATAGCVAVTNAAMDELFTRVELGTKVRIEP